MSTAADWDFETLLQGGVKTLLDGMDYFSNATAGASAKPIPVVCFTRGDVIAEAGKAIAMNRFLVLILPPTARCEHPSNFGPEHDWEMQVHVYENPTLNRGPQGAGQPIGAVATVITKALHTGPVPGVASIYFKSRVTADAEVSKDLTLSMRILTFGGLWHPPQDTAPRA